MTDKKVIINGVNVAGCKYCYEPLGYKDELGCLAESEAKVHMAFCSHYSNCYYKQLQRKEQEIEKLKQEIKLYEVVMITIYNKFHGNTDEHDIQRALGALYQAWRENNDR